MKYPDDLQTELDRARQALIDNNAGLARVCSRRAAGMAIRIWLGRQSEPPVWGASAITQLRSLVEADTVPPTVRHAAARLSTTVAKDHTLPFEDSPLADALIIIQHFLN